MLICLSEQVVDFFFKGCIKPKHVLTAFQCLFKFMTFVEVAEIEPLNAVEPTSKKKSESFNLSY